LTFVNPRLYRASRESDLRFGIELGCFLTGTGGMCSTGKVLVLWRGHDKSGAHTADIRSMLKGTLVTDCTRSTATRYNAANEIEGFLFQGPEAERIYHETHKIFEYVIPAAIITPLPGDPLRTFIDTTAEVQRAMGFQNEKDPTRRVAPSQFEINYGYAEAVAAADHIQLYKLICRQASRATWA